MKRQLKIEQMLKTLVKYYFNYIYVYCLNILILKMFYELSQLIIDKEKAEQEQEYLKKKSFYQSHSSLFKKKKKHCHFL